VTTDSLEADLRGVVPGQDLTMNPSLDVDGRNVFVSAAWVRSIPLCYPDVSSIQISESTMEKTFVLMLLCATAVSNANGATICKLEDSGTGIKAIAWDENDGTAKVTDSLNKTYAGRVEFTRPHSADGKKVNILIKYDPPSFGADAAEYIIFPVGKNQFRVIGVTYIIRNNERYLNTEEGNREATCISL
jgi:hypothetical protein